MALTSEELQILQRIKNQLNELPFYISRVYPIKDMTKSPEIDGIYCPESAEPSVFE